jgi:hypothetical protein
VTVIIGDLPEVRGFRQAAAHFCRLLESNPTDADGWIENVLAAVAKLYAFGHALPECNVSDNKPDIDELFGVNYEEWKRVYSFVQSILATQAGYWAYFDPSEPPDSEEAPMFGDLADDLADIYRDIKPGLRAWDAGLDAYLPDIVFDWKCPFDSH